MFDVFKKRMCTLLYVSQLTTSIEIGFPPILKSLTDELRKSWPKYVPLYFLYNELITVFLDLVNGCD